jgi:hypothetical protein
MIVYKYRNIKDAEYILKFLNLWFARPSTFNDPFDCSITYQLQPNHKESIDKLIKHFIDKNAMVRDYTNASLGMQENVCKAIRDIANKMGIFSVSEINDDILMWSHYADSHKGLAIGIEFNEDAAYEVKYNKRIPLQAEVADVVEDNNEIFKLFFCRKSPHWRYEKERRLFLDISNNGGLQTTPIKAVDIREVIFGLNMEEDKRLEVREWLRNSGIQPQFFEAKKHPSQYKLNIVPIHA